VTRASEGETKCANKANMRADLQPGGQRYFHENFLKSLELTFLLSSRLGFGLFPPPSSPTPSPTSSSLLRDRSCRISAISASRARLPPITALMQRENAQASWRIDTSPPRKACFEKLDLRFYGVPTSPRANVGVRVLKSNFLEMDFHRGGVCVYIATSRSTAVENGANILRSG